MSARAKKAIAKVVRKDVAKIKKKKREKTTSLSTAIAIEKAMLGGVLARQAPRGLKRSTVSDKSFIEDAIVAKQWVRALRNPFMSAPPCLGGGSVGTMMFTNYTKHLGTFSVGASGGLAASLFSRGSTAATVNTTLGSGAGVGLWTAYAGSGDVSLAADYSNGRYMAAGIRWSIRISESSVPGIVMAGLIGNVLDFATVTGSTSDQMESWQGLQTIPLSECYTGVVTYRPLDSQDGEFSAVPVTSNGAFLTTNFPLLLLTGWPSGTKVDLEFVQHVEVVPKPNQYQGTPGSFNYGQHDFGTVLDVAESHLAYNQVALTKRDLLVDGRSQFQPANDAQISALNSGVAKSNSSESWSDYMENGARTLLKHAETAHRIVRTAGGLMSLVGASSGLHAAAPVPEHVYQARYFDEVIAPAAVTAKLNYLQAEVDRLSGHAPVGGLNPPNSDRSLSAHLTTGMSTPLLIEEQFRSPCRNGCTASSLQANCRECISAALSHNR